MRGPNIKKRSSFAAAILALVLAVSGCGQAIYNHNELGSLKFESLEFANPLDDEDIYGAIEYEEKLYVPYGILKKSLLTRPGRQQDLAATQRTTST